MNLTELQQQIRDNLEYPNEATFEANINNFIQRAEERIFYLTQLTDFRINVEGTVNANNPYLLTPDGFKFSYSLRVGNGTEAYLIEKDVNFIREVYPDPAVTGPPRHYALFDDTAFILGPTPDQSYPAELHYGGEAVSITASADGRSWLGDNAENALLYGCLLEGAIFLLYSDEEMTPFKEHFDVDIGRLKNLGEGHQRRDAYRGGQLRQPIT